MCRERQRARSRPRSEPMAVPPTLKLPEVGESMPPIRLSNVVLPLPEGPISATNSPSAMSSERPSSIISSSFPRRYTLRTSRTSINPIVPPSALHPDTRAVLEPCRRAHHHALAAVQPAADLHLLAARRTRIHRARRHLVVLHDPHDGSLGTLDHDGDRHQYSPRRRGRHGASGLTHELHLGTHLGKDAQVAIEDRDLDLDRGLLPIRGR